MPAEDSLKGSEMNERDNYADPPDPDDRGCARLVVYSAVVFLGHAIALMAFLYIINPR